MYEAFPLYWPIGYRTTTPGNRKPSRFSQTMGAAQKALHKEVERINGTNLVVSTNLRIRQDGLIYATDLEKKIDEPGVAIYFKLKGKVVSMCCDQYRAVWENMYALAKSLENLRAIDRYGVSEFLDRSFTGFKELPAAASVNDKDIWKILCFTQKPESVELVKAAYHALAKERHPDSPTGSAAAFHELSEAYQQALIFFN